MIPADADHFADALLAYAAGDLDSAEIAAVLHLLRLRGVSSLAADAERRRCNEICSDAQGLRGAQPGAHHE